jgi:hypothetical protein
MASGRFRSFAATTAIVALVWVLSTPMTPAGALASWGGRVFESDRLTPREGVVISLGNAQGVETLRSEPTRGDGAFRIDGAPAGTYRLTVETPEGTFVSSEPVTLESGSNPSMALSLAPGITRSGQEHGLGGEGGDAGPWIFAGVVTAFALLAVWAITEDDDEKNPSPDEIPLGG